MPLPARYTIVRELGQGGMATVYLAEDRKHGRQVAIKVLRAELAMSLGAERFLREIAIAARLAHPHVVPLIDSGSTGDVLYHVAPYLPGGSLRDRLRSEQRLPIADAVRIAQEVGSGLDFVHRNGFVHRDVKPENILFADGHALIADFGIAHACGSGRTDAITSEGIAVGTPAYMSPEQASAEHNVTTQSDVYSLGVVIYEMLAGEPPFTGTGGRATMARHATEAPRALRTVRPDVPMAIERALTRALAKDPDHRWRTMAEFVAALTVVDEGGHAAKRAVAVLPFVNASADAGNEYLSDGITDELIDALAKVRGIGVASRTSVFALKGKALDVRAIGATLGASVVIEGTLRKIGNQLRITAQLTSTDDGRLMWSQKYERTLDDVFAIQDEIARTIVNTLRTTWLAELPEPRPRRHTDNIQAYGLYLRGRYEWNKRTRESISAAIAYFEQAIAEDASYALAYTGLSDSFALHVDYRSVPVIDGMERAKGYARTALELDDTLAEAHASLAWVRFIYDWEWGAAGREFRRAIELDPAYAPAHQWYAFLLAALGRFDEAIPEGHAAVELDPASVSALRSLGWLYYYARRYDRAQFYLRRALEMNPVAEESYRVLGLVLAQQGEYVEAERVLREGLTLPGAGTYSMATLGWALARAGKRSDAETVLAELEARATTDYVSPVAFAWLYLGLEQWDRVLTAAETAYGERRGWVAYLKVNPILDPVRDQGRFRALVEKMGL